MGKHRRVATVRSLPVQRAKFLKSSGNPKSSGNVAVIHLIENLNISHQMGEEYSYGTLTSALWFTVQAETWNGYYITLYVRI